MTSDGKQTNFYEKTPEQISVAKKVGELRPTPRPALLHFALDASRTVSECWHVVFSPDETRFAWLCGTSTVLIVPWNRFKNCLHSVDPKDNDGNEIKAELVRINAGIPVNSAAFGCGTPVNQLTAAPQRSYWTRFDFSKEMVLATGHVDGRLRIWDVCTGHLKLELLDHRQCVRDMAIAPDGSLRLVTASFDTTLKVWDLRDDGNMSQTLKGHTKQVNWCCWSPDARLLASAGFDKTVIIWNMENYTLLRKLHGHQHNVVSCEFSPDGAVLATASYDTRVILWDPYTGDILKTLCHLYPQPRPIFASGANGCWVKGVAYSKRGSLVASIADDGFIRIWNVLEEHPDPVCIASGEEEMVCCTFSPSGRALAVGTKDSRVSFYEAPNTISSLKHISRIAVRKGMQTQSVDQLDIPDCLKDYLKYRYWN